MNKKIQVTFEIEIEKLPWLRDFLLDDPAPKNQPAAKEVTKEATPVKVNTETVKAKEPEQLTLFDEPKKVTQTDIRAVAAKLVKSGKGSALDALFKKFGATKLSDLAEEKYADFLAALEEV